MSGKACYEIGKTGLKKIPTFCSLSGMGAFEQARSISKTTTGSVRGVNSEGWSWESCRSCKANEEPAEPLEDGG